MVRKQKPEPTPAQIRATEVGGKTVAQWDKEWTRVENGFTAEQPDYDCLLGLYNATLRDDIKYIGNSVELDKGLKKRLRDYSRKSDSARDHYGAQKIIEHVKDVECHVIVVGIDEVAANDTKLLKELMIKMHIPEWNAEEEAIADRRRATYRKRSSRE